MGTDLDLTDEEFCHVVTAYSHFHIGPEMPPFFRDFLALRLRGGAPDLADRIAAMPDEQVERLFVRLRAHQLVD
jgi:hypothetical protein